MDNNYEVVTYLDNLKFTSDQSEYNIDNSQDTCYKVDGYEAGWSLSKIDCGQIPSNITAFYQTKLHSHVSINALTRILEKEAATINNNDFISKFDSPTIVDIGIQVTIDNNFCNTLKNLVTDDSKQPQTIKADNNRIRECEYFKAQVENLYNELKSHE
ncbi:3623_t:CDS:2 [Diversispora eburnea]|uniref:3623_t:CDS:1 n=1 Tax=Diversispora eburnea TaxID=1213867 RepID=A0A9N8WBK0_9GLOM|nr:3623_t:CDS:2 [Diversispora eburnea]